MGAVNQPVLGSIHPGEAGVFDFELSLQLWLAAEPLLLVKIRPHRQEAVAFDTSHRR